MSMRRILCALALLVSPPAWAQTPPEALPDISAAQAIVHAANAEGVFTPLPGEHRIVVRHTRSGLTCRFEPTWSNRIVIFAEAARGEDVACESSFGQRVIRLYATRYAFHTTLDEQFSGAVAALQQRSPQARPLQAAAQITTTPPSQSAHFLIPAPSGQTYSRVSVAMNDDWVIVMRYIAPAPDADAAHRAEQTSSALWASVLGEVANGRL
jgi:hypothetical protein